MQPAPLLPLLTEHPAARRWVVAYSGGLDSHVLLDLCARLRARDARVPTLVALHVDHGVNAASAAWSRHCADVCADLGIEYFARRAEPGRDAAAPVSEEALRAARYREFEAFCGAGDLLLLAHHRDDQVETVLLRLVRGAGVAGLAGMPHERGCGQARLCRPLLEVPREELRGHALAAGLEWIEDPSNARLEYDRNFLRHRVLPPLLERFPGAASAIARAAHNLAQAADICAERTREDLAACAGIDRFGQPYLGLAPWQRLSSARADALLRAWLAMHTATTPDARALQTLREEVIAARADAQPALVLGDVAIRRYRERLYAVAAHEPPPAAGIVLAPGESARIEGAGLVELQRCTGAGVRPGREHRIDFGSPALRCRPVGRPGKTLGQLAQEYGVPPWLRARLPLLFVDGELAAVADLCICEGFAAPAGASALRLRWLPQEPG